MPFKMPVEDVEDNYLHINEQEHRKAIARKVVDFIETAMREHYINLEGFNSTTHDRDICGGCVLQIVGMIDVMLLDDMNTKPSDAAEYFNARSLRYEQMANQLDENLLIKKLVRNIFGKDMTD